MSHPDIVIITASSPAQAKTFGRLLQRRIDHGLYPREIDFRVYSDPEGGRVGSGGGTLLALEGLLRDCRADDHSAFLADHRILIIHAGGESRRLPCYVPEGKLFMPVPVPSSSVIPPVLLDLQLSLYFKYPWRDGEVVVASGDVVIDFDTEQLPAQRGDVCGFAKPSSLEQGSRHGVFRLDRNQRNVVDYYQKESTDYLNAHAALEGTGRCALDMGIVSLSAAAATRLLQLGERTATDGTTLAQKLQDGDAYIDLYLEVLTACLSGISFEEYRKKVQSRTKADDALLQTVYGQFAGLELEAVLTRRTSFLHFGSLFELPLSAAELKNKELAPFYVDHAPETGPDFTPSAVLTDCHDMEIGNNGGGQSFCESCVDSAVPDAGGTHVLVGLENVKIDEPLPEGICIDCRNVTNDRPQLVYGINDTWKPVSSLAALLFCGTPMDRWLEQRGLTGEDIWEDTSETFDLLSARLFPVEPDPAFLPGYWDGSRADATWRKQFLEARRYSIREVNDATSALERDTARMALRSSLLRDKVTRGTGWVSMSAADFSQVFGPAHAGKLGSMYRTTDDALLRTYRKRLLREIVPEGSHEAGVVFDLSYVEVENGGGALRRGVKEDQIVWARSPVRLDLAGGWSDTPPYTLRSGGQVTNVAVDLNGQSPIQVFCRPMAEPAVRIHSIDLGVTEKIATFEELQDYRNPMSPFALPKAALCLLGLTRQHCRKESLWNCLSEVGCGIEITLLSAIPKGSGLGTSSVLGATILAALHRFFGRDCLQEELFRQVLQMEQMLTTGGGWQDQIGGVVGGVKYIDCAPGLRPSPVIHRLDPHLFEDRPNHGRFTLFYTGITRLAKNILQDVVDNSNAMTPAYLFTIDRVRQLAREARDALSLRDMQMLARVINGSWGANILIHPGTSNDEVDALRYGTHGLWAGMKLLGAGGGGYALFLSESESQADALRKKLRRDFENEKARIVDFSLNPAGLQVSVS